jgi:hypothetical protein
MKGQKGIRIVAPDTIDAGTVRSIKPVYVFNVTQTQELAAHASGQHVTVGQPPAAGTRSNNQRDPGLPLGSVAHAQAMGDDAVSGP